MRKALPVLIFVLLSFLQVTAQVPPASTPPAPTDTLKLVEIIYADKNGYKRVDSATELQMLVGKVVVTGEHLVLLR